MSRVEAVVDHDVERTRRSFLGRPGDSDAAAVANSLGTILHIISGGNNSNSCHGNSAESANPEGNSKFGAKFGTWVSNSI